MNNHLTEEQAQQLREALREHPLEAIITLALVTGMRRDELLQLHWQEIDLEKREVCVLNSKTKRGHRTIRFSQEVTEVLRQHRLRQIQARLEAGTAWQNLDLVFPDHTGGPLRPEYLVQEFSDLLARAGLPRLRFHDLRVSRYWALREQVRALREERDHAQAGDLDLDNNTNPW